jgi:hypothetical protein
LHSGISLVLQIGVDDADEPNLAASLLEAAGNLFAPPSEADNGRLDHHFISLPEPDGD